MIKASGIRVKRDFRGAEIKKSLRDGITDGKIYYMPSLLGCDKNDISMTCTKLEFTLSCEIAGLRNDRTFHYHEETIDPHISRY